jgi:hypothetical protein
MVQECKVVNSIQTSKADIVVCIPNDLHYKRAGRKFCMTHAKVTHIRSEMTLNYWVAVDMYPFSNGVVGGSIPIVRSSLC